MERETRRLKILIYFPILLLYLAQKEKSAPPLAPPTFRGIATIVARSILARGPKVASFAGAPS